MDEVRWALPLVQEAVFVAVRLNSAADPGVGQLGDSRTIIAIEVGNIPSNSFVRLTRTDRVGMIPQVFAIYYLEAVSVLC